MLKTSEKIRLLLKRKSMSVTELSEKIGTTRQNLTNKLSRNNFNERDLINISKALEQELVINFIDNMDRSEL